MSFDPGAATRQTVRDLADRIESSEHPPSASDLGYATGARALAADHERLENLLATIATGVPIRDEWNSAADFMEWVAHLLDDSNVKRPEHYPEDYSC